MPSPSPTCTINGSSSANGVNVSAGATVTIQLVDLTATSWTLTCIGTDESNSSPTITINQTTKTATFTAGGLGSAYILKSQVNGGIGVNGAADSSLTTTMSVYVLAANGRRVLAFNETQEGSASYGWIGAVNAPIRADATGGGEAAIPLAASNVTLAPAAYGCRSIRLTGSPVAGVNTYFPIVAGSFWHVANETSVTQFVRGVGDLGLVRLGPGSACVVGIKNGLLVRTVSGDMGESPVFARAGTGEYPTTSELTAGGVWRDVQRWTTTDASPTEIGLPPSLVVIANSTVLLTAQAVAQRSSTADSFAAGVVRAFKVDGANVATAIAAQQSLFTAFATAGAAGLALNAVVNGSNQPDVQITGRAAETWRWTVQYEVRFITQAA